MRVLRERRPRRPYGSVNDVIRPTKRLFTPDIKRLLKGWLVRRRDHPYPNREEKQRLAAQTGLTYVQICNWFANWRRKLKQAGEAAEERTWAHLIRSYNSHARGNVEHISVSSDDSLWWEEDEEEEEEPTPGPTPAIAPKLNASFYSNDGEGNEILRVASAAIDHNYSAAATAATGIPHWSNDLPKATGMLSKWLKSTAHFKPRQPYIPWPQERTSRNNLNLNVEVLSRQREELDAAETLTRLANRRW